MTGARQAELARPVRHDGGSARRALYDTERHVRAWHVRSRYDGAPTRRVRHDRNAASRALHDTERHVRAWRDGTRGGDGRDKRVPGVRGEVLQGFDSQQAMDWSSRVTRGAR